MTTIENTPRIYVGTYAKYNNGSIEGKWLDLTDYSSKEEFIEACLELHSDEKDPELMFQDYENIPEEFIGESWISDDVFEAIEISQKVEAMSESELVYLHNQYCDNINSSNRIYSNDDDFLEEFFSSKSEAVRAALYGNYNYSHNWVQFNGYGNLESFDDGQLENEIDKDAIIKHVIENRRNYDI